MPFAPGHAKAGGRKKGVPNKATAELKAIAQSHAPEAIETLLVLMRRTDNPATQLGAVKELLDRGYGKATQLIAGDPDGEAVRVTEIVLRGVRAGDDPRD